MKKIIPILLLSILVFVGCSKEEKVSLDSNKIVVSENGEFSVTGVSKKNSSFYVNDQIITSKEQSDDGTFTVNVKMDSPEQEANFKIKYLNDDLFDENITFDTSKFEDALTQNSIEQEKAATEASIEKEAAKEQQAKVTEENSDITKLSAEPTSEQESILSELADQQFKETYPYKGSKMKTVLGVIQNWTDNNGAWYYKVEAVIVNEFGAERNANVEVHVTPTGPNTGTVEILDY